MGRTSLHDVHGLADPAQPWNFDLYFDRLPTGVSGDLRELTFRVKTAEFPAASLEEVPVEAHGVKLVYAGRAQYTHELSVTFFEGVSWNVRDIFYAWRELARSWQANTGSSSDVYKASATLTLYTDAPEEAKSVKIMGLWPKNIDAVSLDGGSGGSPVELNISFSFDWLEEA